MTRNSRDFTFDYNLRLKDAGLVAADGYSQVGGSTKTLDLGTGRVDGRVIIDTSAVEVASGDEAYRIACRFSTTSDFSSGIVVGTSIQLGDSSVTGASADNGATERHELPFTNEINGTVYRYMRLHIDVQGTIATGINFTANATLR